MNNNLITHIMPTYGHRSLEFEKGTGCFLISSDNKKYLDFGSGIAVNSLGHCHPILVKKLQNQAEKLWHISNLYYNSEQEDYAKILCDNSFADKIFFTNSGAEAIEASLKVARSYHHIHKNYNKTNIITFEGAFHGRTFAALSAQMNEKYSKGFEPLMSGFIQVPFNNLEELNKNINDSIGAIMIEPIQGEGGINPANLIFLENIRKICDHNNILLILDEVQSGFGRTGKLFSYEWGNFEPDILASAKGIGSGFPLGACFASNNACEGMVKGTHGSTFGGNPLAVSVGIEVIRIITEEGFLEKVDKNARYLWNRLKELEKNYDEILQVRGAGFLLGIKTKTENNEFNNHLTNNGLLCITAADNIIRLAPPLIVEKNEIDQALQIIENTIKTIND
jgi:acetylornithine/N-succinyldiaminopimelate aminotransferase